MSGESFGLVFYRPSSDKGRVCPNVLLNLNEQSFDKLAARALYKFKRVFSEHYDSGWEFFRDRLSFTLSSGELIKVSMKRLPTFKKEQEAYYKLEIFEMPTKSHLQQDS
jgi:hypothetical protein